MATGARAAGMAVVIISSYMSSIVVCLCLRKLEGVSLPLYICLVLKQGGRPVTQRLAKQTQRLTLDSFAAVSA